MTKEQALLIVEGKRSWADLISGEKDELYDAIDVVLAEIDRLKGDNATLRTRLDALVKAGEKVVSREQHAIDGDTFPDDQLLDTVIELGDYRALSAALAEAKGEK